MAEWSTVTLNALAAPVKSAFSTGPFGSAVSAKNFRSDGVPMLRGSNLSEDVGFRLDDADLVYLSPDLASQFTRSTVRSGDLVFTCWGTVGQIGLIDDAARYSTYIVSNKQMKMTPDRDKVDPLFLYYNLSQPRMLDLVKSQAIGSSVPGFNLGQLRVLPVTLPSRSEQQAIADVLGALDDKIAAHRDLATVADDFVRAEFAALALRADSSVTISHLADHPRDLIDPSVLEPDTPYVGLEHVPRRRIWLGSVGRASEVTSTKAAYSPGDVLFGKLRPYFHKVAAAPTAGVCSTDILVVRPKQKALAGYLLAAASSDATVERCTAASEGTRMPRMSWKDLGAVSVPWPGDAEAIEFGAVVDGLRRRIEAAMVESDILGRVRDVLLPELMSGRIRVKAAERVLGEVV